MPEKVVSLEWLEEYYEKYKIIYQCSPNKLEAIKYLLSAAKKEAGK